MGFPKAFFNKDIEELSSFSRGLSLPVRISILKIMLEKATWVSSEEFAKLDLTIVTRDRHLRALTELKLVENIHQNGLMYYRINKPVFSKMISNFNHFFDLYKTDNLPTVNE
jgi:DNA-binding transcriptional ArsR family regulator